MLVQEPNEGRRRQPEIDSANNACDGGLPRIVPTASGLLCDKCRFAQRARFLWAIGMILSPAFYENRHHNLVSGAGILPEVLN